MSSEPSAISVVGTFNEYVEGLDGGSKTLDRGFQVHRRKWWQERQFGEAELGLGQEGRKHRAYSVSFDICWF